MFINEILDKLVVLLSHTHTHTQYSNISRDGRVNSSFDEDILIQQLTTIFNTNEYLLDNKLLLKHPQARDWYDFAIIQQNNNDFFVPVNIKVSKLDKNDNLNCKMGIFYALTGILPHNLSNETSWERVFQKIHENINTYKDKDYYFLIANKQDNTDFFWNSLKQLKSIVPNGNNLPFQAKWEINREKQNRTHEEAGAFILQVFKDSIIKRANIKESFERYLEQHLQEYKAYGL